MNTFFKIACAILFSLSTYGESRGYIALDNGYRWDRISQTATLGGPTITVKGSTLTLKRINSYQLGAKGEWDFCSNLFIRGAGHYGWAQDGIYEEGGFSGSSHGNTYDGYAALGYSYCLKQGIWVAPLAGWSYDAIDLKATDVNVTMNCIKYHLSSIKAHQRFHGPFLGVDLLGEINPCSYFSFGYEFHLSDWRGERLIQGPEYGNPPFGSTTGFSNTRTVHWVHGHVFKMDLAYQFCDCWVIDLGLKYQSYRGNNGHYKRTKVPLISQFTYAKIDGLWWRSFGATISIGKTF